MKATYLYHSGFALFGESANLLIDYFAHPDCPELPRELFGKKPLYVLSSHGHHDHFSPEILDFPEKYGAKLILAKHTARAAGRTDVPFTVLDVGDHYDDRIVRIEAYGSTDEGISFYIELDGKRIFHAGDLNNWHWQEESTKEEIQEAADLYYGVLHVIAKEHPKMDAVFFPVDPRMVTDIGRGAKEFLDAVSCKVFVPMHFWGNFAAANAFEKEATSRGARFVSLHHCGETIEL
ncbi:MAG: MBL fold metallo-hydrolase [Christensenellales bacterium]|jgi:L-ascorbate metabolism protein UlaG (beta-lactamase superfamily)